MVGERDTFVADSHALVWYVTDDPRLGPQARQVLEAAFANEVDVLVPTIVLAELIYMARKGLFSWVDALNILVRIETLRGFEPYPLEFKDIFLMLDWLSSQRFDLEMHDLVVLAAGFSSGAKLITRDEKLQRQKLVETIW